MGVIWFAPSVIFGGYDACYLSKSCYSMHRSTCVSRKWQATAASVSDSVYYVIWTDQIKRKMSLWRMMVWLCCCLQMKAWLSCSLDWIQSPNFRNGCPWAREWQRSWRAAHKCKKWQPLFLSSESWGLCFNKFGKTWIYCYLLHCIRVGVQQLSSFPLVQHSKKRNLTCFHLVTC